jgi:uncharacterized membrane protein
MAALLTAGILTQACWFFMWGALLEHWDLSRLFPFDGLSPALLVIAAWLILKERMPALSWAGLVMICIGITIVSRS